MSEFFQESVYFGLMLTVLTFGVGSLLKQKLKSPLFNPILISMVLCIGFLLVFDIDYEVYQSGAKYISYLLTPATICLGIPLYKQFELLKRNRRAVMAGILSGVVTSLCAILVLAVLFRLDHQAYVTLLPKSITTAIGMDVSAQLGGQVSITVAVILLTGIFGNICAETVFRLTRITDPIAKGIAIGTSAHAVGTAKALELGQVEGAMSSLSIAVAGILTVAGATLFSCFY